MRTIAALILLVAATPIGALASPVVTKDSRFEADVSAGELNRLSVVGEKIAKVRLMGESQGAKMLVEADEQTGDAFVGFQGEVAGRVFSAFLITESGRTLQAVLTPRSEAAQTVLVRISPGDAAIAAVQVASAEDGTPPPPPVTGDARGRQEPYPEIMTALIRVMFNGEAPDGVRSTRVDDGARQAGPFELRTLEVYSVDGLRGSVLSLKNTSKVGQPLNAKVFLVGGVLAAAVSHESVEPGRFARVYLVEAGR